MLTFKSSNSPSQSPARLLTEEEIDFFRNSGRKPMVLTASATVDVAWNGKEVGQLFRWDWSTPVGQHQTYEFRTWDGRFHVAARDRDEVLQRATAHFLGLTPVT
jgi:hypothetical protein